MELLVHIIVSTGKGTSFLAKLLHYPLTRPLPLPQSQQDTYRSRQLFEDPFLSAGPYHEL
jgi:hypothetical protein